VTEQKLRSPLLSPGRGDKSYNRMKYYDALKTAHIKQTGLDD